MVIVDGMRLPPKRILISIGVLIVLVIVTISGYLYKQKVTEDKLKQVQQQKIQKERNDRSSYEATEEQIFNSPNAEAVFKLYDSLLKDFSFMNIAGWQEGEILCEVDSCNIRFTKVKDRVFEYVAIKKGENVYEPVFNEEEMSYQAIVYDIDKKANASYKDDMSKINACTEFISDSYRLNSLFAMDQQNKQKLEIQLPSNVFSLSQEYEWAKNTELKKGILTYNTSNFYTVNYIKDKFMGQLLTFDKLTIDKGKIDITFSYYCF